MADSNMKLHFRRCYLAGAGCWLWGVFVDRDCLVPYLIEGNLQALQYTVAYHSRRRKNAYNPRNRQETHDPPMLPL